MASVKADIKAVVEKAIEDSKIKEDIRAIREDLAKAKEIIKENQSPVAK
jgi:hypothetical protein